MRQTVICGYGLYKNNCVFIIIMFVCVREKKQTRVKRFDISELKTSYAAFCCSDHFKMLIKITTSLVED